MLRMPLSCLVVLLTVAAGAPPAAPTSQPPELPRLRRIWLPAGQPLPVWQGDEQFITVPLVEFDAAWAKAQRTLQRPDAAPALSECRYSATLEGDDLVGSATWRWHAPDKHAAPLRIASWSAAFRGQPTWEDGKPADIAPTGDLGLVLRPPPAGGDTLRFDWSLAGQKRGQERRFRLRLPAAPVAVLEITLPAALQLSGAGNRQSIVCTEQSVSERKWRVLPAAAIDADLLLSVLPEEAGAARPDAVRLRSHYALEPAGGLVRIQMEWTDRPRVKELCFDVDPELHIQEVLNQQVEWQPLPWRAAPGPPRQLYVTVPDGAEGPLLLEIRGYLLPASAPDDAALTLGGMRPSGLSCFSESIQVTTPPGFTLHPAGAPSDWPAPRLEKTAAGTQEVWSLAPEQSCRLMSRPRVRLVGAPIEIAVRQETLWQLLAEDQALSVRATWLARRGQTSFLRYELPAGWSVDHVRTMPARRLAGQTLLARDGQRSDLELQLAEPLSSAAPVYVELRMRKDGAVTVRAETQRLALPLPRPCVCTDFQGWLTVALDRALDEAGPTPLYAARLEDFPGRAISAPPPLQPFDLERARSGEFSFRYDALDASGALVLTPLAPRIRSRVQVEPSRRRLEYDVVLAPVAGATDTLHLHFSAAPPALAWQVRAGQNRVESYQQIDPRTFIVKLARPLRSPLELRATGEWSGSAPLPLLWVANPGRCAGVIHLADPAIAGLNEGPRGLERDPADHRRWHYTAETKDVRLAPAPSAGRSPSQSLAGCVAVLQSAPLVPERFAARSAPFPSAISFCLLVPAVMLSWLTRKRPGFRRALSICTPAAIGFLMLEAAGHTAEERRIFDIYIVPGKGEHQPARCIVPVGIWKQIRDAIPDEGDGVGPVVFRQGRQVAHLEQATLDWTLTCELEVFGARPRDVDLRLGSLRAQEVHINNRRLTQPDVAGARLRLAGLTPGLHHLKIQARATLPDSGPEAQWEVRFPAMAAQRLELTLPTTGELPLFAGARGRTQLKTAGASRRLEADLGATSSWSLRWPPAPSDELRWQAAHRLQRDDGLLKLHTTLRLQGAAGRNAFALRARRGLWPHRVATEPGDSLLDWRVRPTTGAAHLELETAPLSRPELRVDVEWLVAERELWREAVGRECGLAVAALNPAGWTNAAIAAPLLNHPAFPLNLPKLAEGSGRQLVIGHAGTGVQWSQRLGGALGPLGFDAANDLPLWVEPRRMPAWSYQVNGELRLGVAEGDARLTLTFDAPPTPVPASMTARLSSGMTVLAVEGRSVRGWRQEGRFLRLSLAQEFAAEAPLTLAARLTPARDAGVSHFDLPAVEWNGGRLRRWQTFAMPEGDVRLELRGSAGLVERPGSPFGGILISGHPSRDGKGADETPLADARGSDGQPARLAVLASPARAPVVVTRLATPSREGQPFEIQIQATPDRVSGVLEVVLRDWPAGAPLRLSEGGEAAPLILRAEGPLWELALRSQRSRGIWTFAGIATWDAEGRATLPQVDKVNGLPAEQHWQDLGDRRTRRREGPSTGESWRIRRVK